MENGNNIKTLEIDEIQRLPGAVMDISKVIRSFPGVSPRVSFGYNIIVRGGGSFENTFYLDGIEIPAIKLKEISSKILPVISLIIKFASPSI